MAQAHCMLDNYGNNTDTHSEYIMLIIINSSKKCSAAEQRCKGNKLLHFHGNIERFCIVASYFYAHDNKRGRYCWVSITTMVTLKGHVLTLCVHCLSSERGMRDAVTAPYDLKFKHNCGQY